MKNNSLEEYLLNTDSKFDRAVLDTIISKKKEAIESRDEETANYFWKLEHIFVVKAFYFNAFQSIKSKNYERAWNLFDRAEIYISELYENCEEEWLKSFKMDFIKNIIPEYQKLFPYYLFSSREGIIKKEVCSICGQEIRLRGGCNHKIGKLYMGEICYAEVTEYELKCIAIVTNPFDKYAVLRFDCQEFDYGILEKAMSKIKDPYKNFAVDKKYILEKEVERKHTIDWLKSIKQINYSINID